MRCENARELIPLLVMGILKGEEEKELKAHLEKCVECRKLYETEVEREKMLKFPDLIEPPPSLRKKIWERIETRRSFRDKLIPVIAPAFALLVILLIGAFAYSLVHSKPLQAKPTDVKLLYPGENKPVFKDDLQIILVIEGGEDVDIGVKLDGRDISGAVEEEDGVLFIKASPPEEGLHTLTITITDFKTGKTREIVRNFYVVGG